MEQIQTPVEAMYGELRAALDFPSVRDTYRVFGRVLRLAVDQKTSFSALHLGGLFAKLDYLSRECRFDRRLVRMINDTRIRLRRTLALTDDELLECRLYDLKAICLTLAVVYGTEPPVELSRLFPTDEGRHTRDDSVVADYLRLYVSRADDFYVYGTCKEIPDEEICICYHYQGGHGFGDNSYLRPYLVRGAQLNVVRPSLHEGVYFPELLILDPDYLVDITAVCACFEEYAHDATLHLLTKFMPVEDTAATLLGNFAGQLLDQEVHRLDDTDDYVQTYARFLRDNAFKILTTEADSLHDDGLQQQANIRHLVREGLQQRVGHYDRRQVMLEPSFFSELLGLQGRMDLLQLDYRVLVEQKSGKGAWRPGQRPEDAPVAQLKHYVQVLLYQAILHYNHHLPNREIQLLLLYSRYPNGLIGVTAAAQVLHEAIRLRNEIAGRESMYCQGAMGEELDKLTPACLRQRQVSDRFWTTYVEPKLRGVLDPIRQATPLERAYFYRFVTFLSNEHMLSKVGNKTKENSGFAAKWHDSVEEKYAAGNLYDQLTLLSPGEEHEGAVERLVFGFSPDRASEMSNFRTGDIVIAYQYPEGAEPDARATMVLRGSIAEIDNETLTVELRSPQSDKIALTARPPQAVPHDSSTAHTCCYWAVEHDFMESSYRSQYAGMHSFLTAPRHRRDLLLLQRQPEVDASLSLRGEYGAFDDLSLRVRQAKDFFLIIGPPGTGKTSYGMLNTLREQLLQPETNVLVMSYTNRAVDEICSKLEAEGIDYLRLGGSLSCSPEYRAHLLCNRLKEVTERDAMRQLVTSTRVVVGTTTALTSGLQLFRLKRFDLAIIDEASQILEPHLMGLLSARCPDGEVAIRKFVMIGDHKQLPAVVQQTTNLSHVNEAQLQAIGLTDCRLSLFERLLSRYRHDPSVVYMLTRQGRMHQDIAAFPSQAFYDGKLDVVPLSHQLEEMPPVSEATDLPTSRVTFIDVPTPEPVLADKVNLAEAQRIARLVAAIYRDNAGTFDPVMTVGVIVPYRNQISAVRNAICALMPDEKQLHRITIDTVERYQGSQRDYIIYGFTVQRPYQLNFLANNTFEEDGMIIDRKLNVAMTRARRYLILMGDARLLSLNPLFAQLVKRYLVR